MRQLILYLFIITSAISQAQVNYGTPSPETPLPEVINKLERKLLVEHFPKVNHPVQIESNYYWKHATVIYSKEGPVTIVEFGAYLYYNDQWNLRQQYPIKDFDKFFGTKNEQLLQGQPYVWTENWRVGDSLFGGWALWYFIGLTPEGDRICGYQTIHTTSNLLTSKN
ncbi:hypothetical protein [Aureitalea marina]|uniref:Uncharacterized protein n=1 Tax=Aureitalea marina TaxID=930804 RepID=A0A2S7KLQ9_9FLAO|nr:hypothetical protein [Aureitalea marina]PQB03520.1 hypothetical protein BST85_00365 [Aureitalea marina]